MFLTLCQLIRKLENQLVLAMKFVDGKKVRIAKKSGEVLDK